MVGSVDCIGYIVFNVVLCSYLYVWFYVFFFFFSSRRRHTRSLRDWSSDVCSSDLVGDGAARSPDRRSGRLPVARRGRERVARVVDDVRRAAGAAEPGGLELRSVVEIGRASCRERGEVSGGAGGVRERSKLAGVA